MPSTEIAQLIGGRWRDGRGDVAGAWAAGSGALIASYLEASPEDVTEAVSTMRAATSTDPGDLETVLGTVAEALAADEELAALAHDETGFPEEAVRADIALACEALRGLATLPRGQGEPLGVVAVATHWSSPVAAPVWKIGQAVASGNIVVWKPSALAAATSARIARLLVDCGIPLSALFGRTSICTWLAEGDIDAYAFVGTATGARVLTAPFRQRSHALDLSFVAGSAALVTSAADPVKSAHDIAANAFGAAGQRPATIKFAVVHESVAAAFSEELSVAAASSAYDLPVALADEVRRAVDLAGTATHVVRGGVADLQRDRFVSPAVVHGVPYRAVSELFAPFISLEVTSDLGAAAASFAGASVVHVLGEGAPALPSPCVRSSAAHRHVYERTGLPLRVVTPLDLALPFVLERGSGKG